MPSDGAKPNLARAIQNELSRAATGDFDTEALGEAAKVLSKYLDDMVLCSMTSITRQQGLSRSLANIVFDLDNDLQAVVKGSVKVAGSKEVAFSIKEARVKGKVVQTRIPLSLFIEGLESMDGQRRLTFCRRPRI